MLLVFKGVQHVLPSWTRLTNQTSLYDVSHYIFANLEKNVGYDSTAVTISKDTKQKDRLICQTLNGNQTFTFTFESNHIYKTINKINSSGKNPLYVSDCLVENWSLTQIDDKSLRIDLQLQQKGYKVTLTRIIRCLNGRIITDAI